MAEKKLRVGVIGVGYVSKNNFLPVLPRFDDVEFVGLMAGKLETRSMRNVSAVRSRRSLLWMRSCRSAWTAPSC